MKIIISGFSSFFDVDTNPSELLVASLHQNFKKSSICENKYKFVDVECKVLHVSGKATDEWLQIKQNILEDSILNKGNNEEVFFLHFGVSTLANKFNVERFGYNCANFRVPDECGWTPFNESIMAWSPLFSPKMKASVEESPVVSFTTNDEKHSSYVGQTSSDKNHCHVRVQSEGKWDEREMHKDGEEEEEEEEEEEGKVENERESNLESLDPDHLIRMPVNARLESKVDVSQLVLDLKSKGFQVRESSDPGRFVCNYLYFSSLALCCSRPNWRSLFVHIPVLEVSPLEEQVSFAKELIGCILKGVDREKAESRRERSA
eukprot:CAMPEP_0175059810 /NCGR_PEP_ID=MMETSP0052_2-20121109/12638_1 /TAXON_ID=51329 ORGANISM="Polytomella parva, Strain SAG 63-3" /NCGR_SAMPLE_ID=MMETSP0052_2 /ASSEMBLY_ACC=CAM_ASM_000194 /LENGTH=318 /DNA_ID=CAMNT_0016325399 /DNA_START=94 /DNA_END=1050 /DNA_ORIENTATION=+